MLDYNWPMISLFYRVLDHWPFISFHKRMLDYWLLIAIGVNLWALWIHTWLLTTDHDWCELIGIENTHRRNAFWSHLCFDLIIFPHEMNWIHSNDKMKKHKSKRKWKSIAMQRRCSKAELEGRKLLLEAILVVARGRTSFEKAKSKKQMDGI